METLRQSLGDKSLLSRSLERSDLEEAYVRLRELKSEDIQTILISLFEDRAKDIEPKDLLRQATGSRFLDPSPVSQRELISFNGVAIDVLPENFEAIQLSPLGPLGTNAVLCGLSQKTVIATSRCNEVISDASPILAIEYAKRRRKNQKGQINFFTSERVVRAQNFDVKGFTSHFQALFLFSADKFEGRWELIERMLEEHIGYYLRLIYELSVKDKYSVKKVTVSLSNLMILEVLISKYKIDRKKLMTNTQTVGFDVFKDYDIKFPNKLKTTETDGLESLTQNHLEAIGIKKPFGFLLRNCTTMIGRLVIKYPSVNFDFDFSRIAGIGYYDDLCFKITAENEDGELYPLADGGFTDWTRQLVQSEKEICISSGFGAELFINKFKKK